MTLSDKHQKAETNTEIASPRQTHPLSLSACTGDDNRVVKVAAGEEELAAARRAEQLPEIWRVEGVQKRREPRRPHLHRRCEN